MARALTERVRVLGVLRTLGPLHVGGSTDSPETDMPLAVDGQGRLLIPGTSVTGPIREWVESQFSCRDAKAVFGFQEKDDGAASLALVEDALVRGETSAIEIWDSVGIDREYGSAARYIKFDRAVLPRGTELGLDLTVELTGSDADPRWLAIVGHALRALAHAEIPFGGGITGGQGRVELGVESLQLELQDWSSKAGVLAFLEGTMQQFHGKAAIDHLIARDLQVAPKPRETLGITIAWRPVGPVMSKASEDGDAVDILPFVSNVGGDKVALALSGRGMKGVLRTRAERIVRTVRGGPRTPWPADPRRRHRRQVDEPVVADLFGLPRPERKNGKAVATGTAGRGAVTVDVCYAERALRDSAWRAIASARADSGKPTRNGLSPLYEAIRSADPKVDWLGSTPGSPARLEQSCHVAIDRWLGGAAEHFLFSALEPWDIPWAPIQLDVDLRRLADSPEKQDGTRAALALLLLVLRDLAAGTIPVGFGGNRGFGTVEVASIAFTVSTQDSAVHWLDGIELPRGDLTGLPEEVMAELQKAWSAQIAAWQTKEKRDDAV